MNMKQKALVDAAHREQDINLAAKLATQFDGALHEYYVFAVEDGTDESCSPDYYTTSVQIFWLAKLILILKSWASEIDLIMYNDWPPDKYEFRRTIRNIVHFRYRGYVVRYITEYQLQCELNTCEFWNPDFVLSELIGYEFNTPTNGTDRYICGFWYTLLTFKKGEPR